MDSDYNGPYSGDGQELGVVHNMGDMVVVHSKVGEVADMYCDPASAVLANSLYWLLLRKIGHLPLSGLHQHQQVASVYGHYQSVVYLGLLQLLLHL